MDNFTTTQHPSSIDMDSLSPAVLHTCVIIQGILCLVGGVGNSLTLIAIAVYRKLHRYNHIYIAQLAFVDLIISTVLVPSNIRGYITDTPPSNCELIAALTIICMMSSVLSLLLISLNRYVLICRDHHTYFRRYNKCSVTLSILGVWLLGILVVIPLKAIDGLGWEVKTRHCVYRTHNPKVHYYLMFFGTSIIIPAILTFFYYIRIALKLRLRDTERISTRRSSNHVREEGESQTDSEFNWSDIHINPESTSCYTAHSQATNTTLIAENVELVEYNIKRDSLHENQEDQSHPTDESRIVDYRRKKLERLELKTTLHKQRIRGLMIISVIFIVCSFPISTIIGIDYNQKISSNIYALLSTLFFVNSSVNVFCYGFINQMYRYALKQIVTCRVHLVNKS